MDIKGNNSLGLEVSAESVFRFQINRGVTYVFKHSLDIVDELRAKHIASLQKLKAALPSQYHKDIDLANPFDANDLTIIRKRILTAGNDCIRNLDEQFLNYKEFTKNGTS